MPLIAQSLSPIRFSLCLAFVLSIQATHAQSSVAAEEVLKEAIRLHQAGNVESAIPAYQKYLVQQHNSLIAHSNLVAAFARSGRYQEAIVQYRHALKLQPGNTPVELNLGLAYYKTNQTELAAITLEKVHRVAPDQLQPTLLLADCWMAMGKHKQVIQLLTPLSDKSPEDMAVTYLLGTALVRDNQVERGQRVIDRILSKGDSAEARLLLGTTRLQAQEFPAALTDLTKAVELNPNLPEVYAYYGQALLRTGDPVRAADAFRKALAANHNDYQANMQLAVLLKEEAKMADARQLLQYALQIRGGDIGARYQLATIDMSEEGKDDSARRQLEQIVKEAPEFTSGHVALATVYYRLKRKADGDRERAIVQKLNTAAQAKQQQGVNVK